MAKDESKDYLYRFAQDYIDDYNKKTTGAVFEWNQSIANEFAQIPIETLIRDPYFLGFGDKVYDGVLQDIVDLFEERKKRQVNLVIFMEGIGSGKTTKSSIITWLQWFELSLIDNPQDYFDLAPSSVIALINMNRCISGDSLIISNQGIKRIDSWFNKDMKVKTSYPIKNLELSSRESKSFADSIYYNGKSETMKIITSEGLFQEGIPDHPILTSEGYKLLKDTQLGDKIVCQYNQQMFGNNKKIPEDLAYVLGVLTGDGAVGHERGYIKWCSDKSESEHSEKCVEVINKYFGKGYNCVTKGDYADRNVYIYSVINEGRKRFRILLDDIGMNTHGDFKEVPTCILEAPKEVQIAFLRGCFDTDGSALDTRPTVKLTSTSHKLLQQIQIMLLNLGIISKLNKPKRKKKIVKAWTLIMNGIQTLNFSSKIGFNLERKQNTLLNSLENHIFYNTKDMIDDTHWLSEIVGKETGLVNETYDFTLDLTHNFCSNGIINHNTEKQAKKVTFTEVFNRFQCGFNKDYFPIDSRFTTEIRISRNNTTIFPGTSSALSALGYNLYGSIIDEAAFLEVTEDSNKTVDGSFDACEEMYNAIYNRMTSRFMKQGKLPGMICMISSPNFPDDFMHKQMEFHDKIVKEANERGTIPDSGVFYRRRPMWEAKGHKFYPDFNGGYDEDGKLHAKDNFYIDTDNAEIISDPKVIELLNAADAASFPIVSMEAEYLSKVAQYLKVG